MAYIEYDILFTTLHAEQQLEVCIYDDGSSAQTRRLKGAAEPFITEEENDADMFMPVRQQSGYLNIVDDGKYENVSTGTEGAFDWNTLLPTGYLDRPIVLRVANTSNVLWRGFIQHQQPESTIYEMPVERSLAVYDALGVLEFLEFNVGISSPTTNTYVNFAYLVKRIIDTLPAVARPAYCYFQGGTYANTKLLGKVNPMLFCEVTDQVPAGQNPTLGFEANISALHPKYSCREVLENICKFWGWSCRTYNGDFYFVQDVAPSGADHQQYRRYSYSQLSSAASGSSNQGDNVDNPSEYSYDGTEVVSTENNLSSKNPVGYVSVKSDAGAYKELIKMFPDNPRRALASNVLWNGGGEPVPLRISQNVAANYYADSHYYQSTVNSNYKGNIFGLRSESEKWGVGDLYTYTYMAGLMFQHQSGATGQVRLISRWPFNFKDCRLSMKATIFRDDGTEYKETHEDTDVFGEIGMGYANMVMKLYCANGTTYYWKGDRWWNGEATFGAYVGGGDGYIYPQSAVQKISGQPAYYRPRKYITFETLTNYYNVPPVGRLEIAINYVALGNSSPSGIADMTVEVERTPLPSVHDSVKEDNEYVAGDGQHYKSYAQEDWSEDTIFSSDNVNQFGIGTVLNADNTPMEKVQMNSSTIWRPEQWVADMIYQFGRQMREVLCTEMNRAAANVQIISPRSRMNYKTVKWYPFAISHYWRDDVKKIYAISIDKGTSQVVVTVIAGTGISSVSPAGIVSVLYGDALPLSCVAAVGYFFDHWLQDGSEVSRQQNFTLYNITSNTTLTAVGIENTTEYIVAIISNAPGVTSVSGAGMYRVGTQQTINCAVASGYRFLAWTENNAQGEVISNSQQFQLTVNRDITLYPLTEATASDIYRIYFHIINPGWGNICRGSEVYHTTYNDGDSYEDMIGEDNDFWPEPASGYEFVKWQMNGDDYSTNERITLEWGPGGVSDGDILTAVFKEAPAPPTSLTLYLQGNTAGAQVVVEINGSTPRTYKFGNSPTDDAPPFTEVAVTVPVGATVKLTAQADPYYTLTFGNFYDMAHDVQLSTVSPYSFTMNSDMHISVNFR